MIERRFLTVSAGRKGRLLRLSQNTLNDIICPHDIETNPPYIDRGGFFMAELEKKFYLVREDILPESMLKTALAKEMLTNGESQAVSDAVDKAGIARSTFYKYKDGVFSIFNADNAKILNISLLLNHISGILSGVINCIAALKGNILTINQNLPLHGVAYVTISLSIEEMTVSLDELLLRLGELDGVQKAEIIAKS